jgi:molybdopterin-guanine dinucleotide biosynthesis protein A
MLAVVMANVFISHRTSDMDAAKRLDEDLRRAGHATWLDDREIGVGDSILGKMQEGLAGSTYLVLCYSTAGVDSPWASREWLSALARQLNGQGVKVLPIRLTGGEPPALLADIKYADLVRDWDKGLKELLAAIR